MDHAPHFILPAGAETYDSEAARASLPEEDRVLFDACLQRFPNWSDCRLVLLIRERVPADAPAYKHPGWLEYGMQVIRPSGSQMYIGCIQRQIGAEPEFHS